MQANQVISALDQQIVKARAYQGLDSDVFNWKPEPSKWSVAQCIDHLNATNRSYLPALEAVARQPDYRNPTGIPMLSRFAGQYLVSSMNPDKAKKTKMPAPKAFQPAQSALPFSVIEEFAQLNEQLKTLVTELGKLDGHNTIVASPAAWFIHFRLEGLLDLIAWHGNRHLAQADGVIALQQSGK